MAWEQLAMIPEPSRAVRALSAKYGVPLYRRRKGVPAPKYAKLGTVTIPCDECFANQHEGVVGIRAQAKSRRTVPATPRQAATVLNLCRLHAALWQERDLEDVG